jgi:hypothetical protein
MANARNIFMRCWLDLQNLYSDFTETSFGSKRGYNKVHYIILITQKFIMLKDNAWNITFNPLKI